MNRDGTITTCCPTLHNLLCTCMQWLCHRTCQGLMVHKHTYLLRTFACCIYLIAVKHVLSNVDWSLNVWIHLWHWQGTAVPRLWAVLRNTVLIQVGAVQLVEGLGAEIAWQSVPPLWVCYCLGEVPATPGVPHHTGTLHLLSQKVNVVESSYATGRGAR